MLHKKHNNLTNSNLVINVSLSTQHNPELHPLVLMDRFEQDSHFQLYLPKAWDFLFYFSESIRHKATPTAYLLNIRVILILSL